MYQDRIKRLRKIILSLKLDAVLISSPANITYLTSTSIFIGGEREAFLLITKNNSKPFIVSDPRYEKAINEHLKHFQYLNYYKDLPKLGKKIKKLGIEEDDLTVYEYKNLEKYFSLETINLTDLRTIKTINEINLIKQVCDITDKTFTHILTKLSLSLSEEDIALKFFMFAKNKGALLSFPPIVAFGKNSEFPHHKTSNHKLNNNDKIILLDFGLQKNNYCSDMTRTVFNGKPDNISKKIYQTVYETQNKAIDFIAKNLKSDKNPSAKDIDNLTKNYLKRYNFKMPHSLGHGIGIKVHEKPYLSIKSKGKLKNGMVFTIEPGIYIPNYGGIRIEDMFYIYNNKLERLTYSPANMISI